MNKWWELTNLKANQYRIKCLCCGTGFLFAVNSGVFLKGGSYIMRKRHSIDKAEWSETRRPSITKNAKILYLHMAIDSSKWMARFIWNEKKSRLRWLNLLNEIHFGMKHGWRSKKSTMHSLTWNSTWSFKSQWRLINYFVSSIRR